MTAVTQLEQDQSNVLDTLVVNDFRRSVFIVARFLVVSTDPLNSFTRSVFNVVRFLLVSKRPLSTQDGNTSFLTVDGLEQTIELTGEVVLNSGTAGLLKADLVAGTGGVLESVGMGNWTQRTHSRNQSVA